MSVILTTEQILQSMFLEKFALEVAALAKKFCDDDTTKFTDSISEIGVEQQRKSLEYMSVFNTFTKDNLEKLADINIKEYFDEVYATIKKMWKTNNEIDVLISFLQNLGRNFNPQTHPDILFSINQRVSFLIQTSAVNSNARLAVLLLLERQKEIFKKNRQLCLVSPVAVISSNMLGRVEDNITSADHYIEKHKMVLAPEEFIQKSTIIAIIVVIVEVSACFLEIQVHPIIRNLTICNILCFLFSEIFIYRNRFVTVKNWIDSLFTTSKIGVRHYIPILMSCIGAILIVSGIGDRLFNPVMSGVFIIMFVPITIKDFAERIYK